MLRLPTMNLSGAEINQQTNNGEVNKSTWKHGGENEHDIEIVFEKSGIQFGTSNAAIYMSRASGVPSSNAASPSNGATIKVEESTSKLCAVELTGNQNDDVIPCGITQPIRVHIVSKGADESVGIENNVVKTSPVVARPLFTMIVPKSGHIIGSSGMMSRIETGIQTHSVLRAVASGNAGKHGVTNVQICEKPGVTDGQICEVNPGVTNAQIRGEKSGVTNAQTLEEKPGKSNANKPGQPGAVNAQKQGEITGNFNAVKPIVTNEEKCGGTNAERPGSTNGNQVEMKTAITNGVSTRVVQRRRTGVPDPMVLPNFSPEQWMEFFSKLSVNTQLSLLKNQPSSSPVLAGVSSQLPWSVVQATSPLGLPTQNVCQVIPLVNNFLIKQEQLPLKIMNFPPSSPQLPPNTRKQRNILLIAPKQPQLSPMSKAASNGANRLNLKQNRSNGVLKQVVGNINGHVGTSVRIERNDVTGHAVARSASCGNASTVMGNSSKKGLDVSSSDSHCEEKGQEFRGTCASIMPPTKPITPYVIHFVPEILPDISRSGRRLKPKQANLSATDNVTEVPKDDPYCAWLFSSGPIRLEEQLVSSHCVPDFNGGYFCPDCGWKSMTHESASRHAVAEHNIEIQCECGFCHQRYSWLTELGLHILTTHLVT